MTRSDRAEQIQETFERSDSQFFESLPACCYTISPRGKIFRVNRAACEGLGYSEQELVGKPLTTLCAPESQAKMRQLLEKGGAEKLCNEELVVVTKHGEKRTVLLSAASVKDQEGKLLYSTCVQVDITERKRTEHKLREDHYRRAISTVPAMIWMSDMDNVRCYFNPRWLEFTGQPLMTELRNGWADRVHPEDWPGFLDTFTEACARREPFHVEYRLLRHDGVYRWIFEQGIPEFNADGSLGGYIGSGIDVTERKLAEESLSRLSHQLIQAQDLERSRLARELHDDIQQQLVLLAVALEGLKRRLPASAAGLEQDIGRAHGQLVQVTRDIQALSYRLHSSKLEFLGLAKATTALCREIFEQQGTKIDFQADNVPEKLPHEISLCLFRVLQEALQNAIKHSGSRSFRVSLSGRTSEIELTVRDSGRGFEPEKAMIGSGLGLTSMRERLRAVGGKLSIDSTIKRGTTVRALVPFPSVGKSTGNKARPKLVMPARTS